ncbi:MAG: hypothetical protein J5959_02495 [Butyrivibrio sp.]|nr:hypothetical protein [Butyrivibrio sp.]MBP3240173.1 hypothetical protein [Oribacterium sp.]
MGDLRKNMELDNEIYKLECIKCNLDVIALGMNHDTMGEDKLAVEACASMLGVIHDRMTQLLGS